MAFVGGCTGFIVARQIWWGRLILPIDEKSLRLLSEFCAHFTLYVLLYLERLLVTVALFVLPGHLLHSLILPEPEPEPLQHLAISLGLSMAMAPLILLLCTAAGIKLDGTTVIGATVLLGCLALLTRTLSACLRSFIFPSFMRSPVSFGESSRYWRMASTGFRDLRRWATAVHSLVTAGFAFVFAISLILRFLQVRDLVLPLWIDSVHHTLISQLIVEKGGVPRSYEPLLPMKTFIYHFGFHSLVALFHWLSGLEMAWAVLIVGQLINGFILLPTYLLVMRLARRRLAGLIGAVIVGTISLMPAYYVTWGRYTQLAGLTILPVAIVLTLDGIKVGRRSYRRLVMAGLALAGLFLTHYSITIFYACFLAVYLLTEGFAHRREPRAILEPWLRVTIICLFAVIVALPWLINLMAVLPPLSTLPSWLQGPASYNAFPRGFLFVGHTRELIALSVGGALFGLFKRERGVVLTTLWVLALFLLTNPSLLGLPSTWLVNNEMLVISLFLPFAILGGYFLSSLSDVPLTWLGGKVASDLKVSNRPSSETTSDDEWSRSRKTTDKVPHRRDHSSEIACKGCTAYRAMLGLLIALAALWGARGLLPIVNPVTVLATRDDVVAMDWICENTLEGAKFLINTRLWQGRTYVGTDGGYWIPLLTGRQTTLPPAIYIYSSPEYIAQVNALAEVVAVADSLDDEGMRKLLREEGVTHVYIGAKGGKITPQMLLDSPHYRLVYSSGGVWIFEANIPRD